MFLGALNLKINLKLLFERGISKRGGGVGTGWGEKEKKDKDWACSILEVGRAEKATLTIR